MYEKAGFKFDSIEKDALEFDGARIDSINMKLTRDDWMKSKKAIVHKLDYRFFTYSLPCRHTNSFNRFQAE